MLIVALEHDELSPYLVQVGLAVDAHFRLVPTNGIVRDWVEVQAPNDAANLLLLSRVVASVLPSDDWIIFQFNSASYFDAIDRFHVARLVFGELATLSTPLPTTLFFDDHVKEARLLLSELIFLTLMNSAHAQIVSSACRQGECVSIEDGYIYVSVDPRLEDALVTEARSQLQGLKPVKLPEWMFMANGDYQFPK